MHRHTFSLPRLLAACLLVSGIALASCSPTRVHKRPPHQKGDGFVSKIFHRREMPCGC